MSWTAANPVNVGDPTKKKSYDLLWDNVQYIKTNVMSSGVVLLFANNSPPTGWTRKTGWGNSNKRMFVYSTGNISTGGGLSATTDHTHTIANHNHMWYLDTASTQKSYDSNGDAHTPVRAPTDGGGIHWQAASTLVNESLYTNNASLTPAKSTCFKYQSVIAATKDAY